MTAALSDKASATAGRVVKETGREVNAMACDVTKHNQIEACIAKTAAAFGGAA